MKKLYKQLKYSWHVMMHPIDGFYELQYLEKGSVLSATILIAAFLSCVIVNEKITNFVFNLNGLKDTSPIQLFVYCIVPLFIWVLSNYLVGAITNGQGSFKTIYITTAYALLPYICFSIPIAIVSNVLTDAEETIYGFLVFVVNAWVVIMLYLQVKEVQEYEIYESFKNIVLIIFTAILIIIFSVALYGIVLQSYSFLIEFLREVLAYD
ncbi:MAG: Yip1 family protein [Bacillota bacterium]|nr:Yip1 family protein [Bacillota bacterium]